MTTRLYSSNYDHQKYSEQARKGIPDFSISFVMSMAALSAKCTNYIYSQEKCGRITLFKACNDQCFFVLQFNSETNRYTVDYKAYDNSYNYKAFKDMIDFYLL